MFVHFERWTLPVLTTWMYAWQDKTVIDAHDKLLKLFSNTSTFRNQYIYIYIYRIVSKFATWATEESLSTFVQCSDETWKLAIHPWQKFPSVNHFVFLLFFLFLFFGFYFCFCFWFKLQECLHTQETVLFQVDKYYRTSALPLQFLT